MKTPDEGSTGPHSQTEWFTSADPLGYGDGGNLYAYAGNNPTSATDRSGLCPICAGAAIGGVVGFGAYALTHRGKFDPQEAARCTLLGALAGVYDGRYQPSQKKVSTIMIHHPTFSVVVDVNPFPTSLLPR